MSWCLVLLPPILAFVYPHPATGFTPAFKPVIRNKFKHCVPVSTSCNLAACSTPRHTGSAAACCASRHRGIASYKQRVLRLSSRSTTEMELGDTDYEPERSPGRILVPREPRIQVFEAWTTRAGCRGSASLSHADFEGLRGIMTENAIEPWQPVVTLPASLFLEEPASSGGSILMNPPTPLSRKAWERCPWWVRLGVRLLVEKAAGESSRLKEYVGILPCYGGTGTPANWPSEQLERLYYPRLLSQVKLQQRLFKGFQKCLLADAQRANNPHRTEDGARALVDALADATCFNWALDCVLSRAFQLPPDNAVAPVWEEGGDVPVRAPEVEPPAPEAGRMALLPMIDSMNHYSRMPTHMYWEADGAISVAVGAQLDPGDHVFLSYGPVSNDDLLQYYGFVERENPADTYVLEDMGKWLKEEGLLSADVSARLLSCTGAREVWRYLRRGVFLRDAVHPSTMQAARIICCEGCGNANSADGNPISESRWDGTEADLSRFSAPVSLPSEISAYELLMRYSAREADAWGDAGVAAALAEDPAAPGLDGDLDGLDLDADRRLMLSVFRQEKLILLRGIVSRLTHMRKVSDLLRRPIKMPVTRSPPPVLGASVSRASRTAT